MKRFPEPKVRVTLEIAWTADRRELRADVTIPLPGGDEWTRTYEARVVQEVRQFGDFAVPTFFLAITPPGSRDQVLIELGPDPRIAKTEFQQRYLLPAIELLVRELYRRYRKPLGPGNVIDPGFCRIPANWSGRGPW